MVGVVLVCELVQVAGCCLIAAGCWSDQAKTWERVWHLSRTSVLELYPLPPTKTLSSPLTVKTVSSMGLFKRRSGSNDSPFDVRLWFSIVLRRQPPRGAFIHLSMLFAPQEAQAKRRRQTPESCRDRGIKRIKTKSCLGQGESQKQQKRGILTPLSCMVLDFGPNDQTNAKSRGTLIS